MSPRPQPIIEQPVPNVLLVGEDPKQTELYSDLIREVADCHLDVVSRIESSVEWIGRSNYNLVLIDASGQPGERTRTDGVALLEKVKRISPMTSVILISEQATVEEAVAAIRMGAEDYLKRPFSLETFHLAVKRGLDRKVIFGSGSNASSYLNLLNSCQMISATLEERKILGIVRSYILRELQSDHGAIYSYKDGELKRVDDASPEERKDRAMEEILDIALQAANPAPKMIDTQEFYRFIERGHVTPGLFLFRFRCVGGVDYFCVCLSPQPPASLDLFESRLRMLKAQIEVSGRNIEHYMGVQHLVYVDDATGLYNTRYLSSLLDREIAQAQATGKSFAILFIDADKFKGVNDSHGHLVGTKLLNELGEVLKTLTRDSDSVFRYGGDEFVAVLSPCDLETAKVVAERIRKAVEARSFIAEEGLNIHFTVSIGVALYPDHASSKKQVIEAADHAMYAAKRKTRNSVFIADLNQIEAETSGAPKAAPGAAPKKR